MINSTAATTWLEQAACAGSEGYILSAGEAEEPAETLAKAVEPLVRACVDCPVLKECYDRVRPKGSQFDGVCAARLWINGQEAARAPSAPPLPKSLVSRAGVCGEPSGVRGHRRAGEPLCGQCRITAQRAESRAAGAATIRKRGARSARRPLAAKS
ncbi:hypothetical protein AB0N09_17105 [Streptomyces erythrochromogenes]|uniref:hypothetical protein n=1 Tax=Streptomyces TaxID=1883 RepID=UPI00341BAF4C